MNKAIKITMLILMCGAVVAQQTKPLTPEQVKDLQTEQKINQATFEKDKADVARLGTMFAPFPEFEQFMQEQNEMKQLQQRNNEIQSQLNMNNRLQQTPSAPVKHEEHPAPTLKKR